MAGQGAPGAGALYSRAELELELGRLALTLGRLQAAHKGRPSRAVSWPQPAVNEFLETCVRLLARTRRAHRGLLIERLSSMASSAELGIIGLEEWLREHPAPYATSDKRMAINVSWKGDGGTTTTSSGQAGPARL